VPKIVCLRQTQAGGRVPPHQRLRAGRFAADVGFREVCGLRPRLPRRERSISLRPKLNSSAPVVFVAGVAPRRGVHFASVVFFPG
jgi:hypothetical protein